MVLWPSDLINGNPYAWIVRVSIETGPCYFGDFFPSSMREAYLRQGGKNPDIIAQMTDLEEDTLSNASPAGHKKRRGMQHIHSILPHI